MNRLIETMFSNRGITDISSFMSEIDKPECDILKDINTLSSYLHDIKEQQKHIVIIPDFDMDGIMSGVLGFAGLSLLGFRVSLFIPNPSEGYEITSDTIDRLISEQPDVDAILTCDVGISCIKGIDYAISKGIDVFVTDHHIQTQDMSFRNNARVIVDPMRCDESYSHPHICGAYVLYQCLYNYADTYCDVFVCEQIKRLRVFAGIGTVSDMMPILYENRSLVKDSVSICRLFYTAGLDFIDTALCGCDVYRRAFKGLFLSINIFDKMGVISYPDDIDETFFGYYLAPMFNSTKRMNGDMNRVFGVFFGPNPLEDVDYMYELNLLRKQVVSEAYKSILSTNQPYAPFIYISDANEGVLGLLAAKLMGVNDTPTLVVRKTGFSYKGSGRSLNFYPFLSRVGSAGYSVAGHNGAFGVMISDDRELISLYNYLKSDFNQVVNSLPSDVLNKPTYDFVIATDDSGDTNIDLMLFFEYLSELKRFAPFGVDFPPPSVLLKFNSSDGQWSIIGKMKQHLKIKLAYGFEVLCFNQADMFDLSDECCTCCVSGSLSVNEFNGKYTINFLGNLFREDVADD